MQFKTLQVVDIRDKLPRKARVVALRSLSKISLIAVHHAGDGRVWNDQYDAIAEYTSQANYHIRKVWGTSASGAKYYGDGIMYHFKIHRDGTVYWTRNLEEATWHASNANPIAIGVCLDGDLTKQKPSKAQIVSLKKLLDELCTQHAEFPANHTGVYGHGELKKYKCYTACPGSALQYCQEYRDTGDIAEAALPATDDPRKEEEPKKDSGGFSDLQEGEWFTPHAEKMIRAGLMNGFGDGTWRPAQPVSRAELATILSRFAEKIGKPLD